MAPLEAQAAHLLGAKSDFKIRRAVEGRRWWKIGPLQLHDEWHMQELIARFGLAALPGSLAVSKAGPFRSFAFFASVGEPSRMTLDDGSWGASPVELVAAKPPPRRQLPATAKWGGPRHVSSAAGAPASAVGAPLGAAEVPGMKVPSAKAAAVRAPAVGVLRAGVVGAGAVGNGPRPQVAPGADRVSLEERLDRLVALVQQQNEELRQLRLENAALRARLDGVRVHDPYGPSLPVQTLMGAQEPSGASLAGAGAGVLTGSTPSQPPVDLGLGVSSGLGTVSEDDVPMSPTKVVHPSEKGVISPDPKRMRGLGASRGDGFRS